MPGKTNKQTAEEKEKAQHRTREARKASIFFYEKYTLSVEEACLYYHIGEKKMVELIRNNPKEKWILRNGKRTMIKRDLFAKWLDKQSEI